MKFATLSHLMHEDNIKNIPPNWITEDLIISPELDINGTMGYVIALKLLPKQVMEMPREEIREKILNTAVFAYDELGVDVIQLGALTTSVTSGGCWLVDQNEYKGYVNNGDSYTAAVTCKTTEKIIDLVNKDPEELNLAIIGAYGIIGEAVSILLTPKFRHTLLIGRRWENLKVLSQCVQGNFELSKELYTNHADVLITATSHPTALLESKHLKKNAIVVDVSQPANLTMDVLNKRTDVIRVDGGFVDFPESIPIPIPGLPVGKNFACIAEVIMQAMERDENNYTGSIDLNYLKTTDKRAKKYGFTLGNLTNFGKLIKLEYYAN